MKILADIENKGRFSLKSMTDFPLNAELGEFCYKDNILYIYTQINSVDGWLPLIADNNVTYYIHEQKTPSNLWNIQHDLNTKDIIFQVYNELNHLLLAEINIVDDNTCEIQFSSAEQGKCLIISLTSKLLETASNVFLKKEQSSNIPKGGLIPIASDDGKLDNWISDASVNESGKVIIAQDIDFIPDNVSTLLLDDDNNKVANIMQLKKNFLPKNPNNDTLLGRFNDEWIEIKNSRGRATLEEALEVGSVFYYYGKTAPSYALKCDGSPVEIEQNIDLFNKINHYNVYDIAQNYIPDITAATTLNLEIQRDNNPEGEWEDLGIYDTPRKARAPSTFSEYDILPYTIEEGKPYALRIKVLKKKCRCWTSSSWSRIYW